MKLTSRGPVFYADERVGLGEQTFRMLEFRTMVAGAASRQAALEEANEASGALFKIRDDPRVTRRRPFSPSLLDRRDPERHQRAARQHVARRPAAAAVARLTRSSSRGTAAARTCSRDDGLRQIAGRSDLSFDDLVRLDFYYLENWSLWLDITILGKTLPAVVARRGAY